MVMKILLILSAVLFVGGIVCLLGKNGVKTVASIYAIVISLLPLGLVILIIGCLLSLIF